MSYKNKLTTYQERRCGGGTRLRYVQLLRQLAARDRITMAEVIERALELYANR
jgi:hypothetical protein